MFDECLSFYSIIYIISFFSSPSNHISMRHFTLFERMKPDLTVFILNCKKKIEIKRNEKFKHFEIDWTLLFSGAKEE